MLLKDKVAIITGAASARGLGFATARIIPPKTARKWSLSTSMAKPVKPPRRH